MGLLDGAEWKVVNHPGFLGKKRDAFVKEMDTTLGYGRWRFAWEVGENLLEFHEAIMLYEDAYYFAITGLPVADKPYSRGKKVEWSAVLTSVPEMYPLLNQIMEYQEIYDNATSNIESGTDYSIQENGSNHYQDISVRRVLVRTGRWFRGGKKELLHVRHSSKQKLGRSLSPGSVPFHIPHLIGQPELKGWWMEGSTESWWQTSKVLVVKKVKG